MESRSEEGIDVFDLPEEVYEIILKLLSIRDLVACSAVSQKWRLAVNLDSLWKNKCKDENFNDISMKRTPSRLLINPSSESTGLDPLCYWRQVYGWNRRLQKNWDERKYEKYNLSETSSPVYSLDYDGIHVVTGHGNSLITVWSVETVPYLVHTIKAELEDCPVISVKTTSRYVVAVQKKLLHVFQKDSYELVNLKSFELGNALEQIETCRTLGTRYSSWYKETLRIHEVTSMTPLIHAFYESTLFASTYTSAFVKIWSNKEDTTKNLGSRKLSQIEISNTEVYFVAFSSGTDLFRYFTESGKTELLLWVPGRKKFIIGDELILTIPSSGDVCLKRITIWKKGKFDEPFGTKSFNSSNVCVLLVENQIIYSEDNFVRVWNPYEKTIRSFTVGSNIGFIRAGFGHSLVVFMNSSLHLWNWKNGKRLYRLYNALEWTGDYRHLLRVDSTSLLSAGVNHQLEMISFL